MIRGILLWFCLATTALASDDKLYPNSPDPNEGFLRVIAPGQSFVVVAGKTRRLNAQGITNFLILPSGQTEVSWAQGSAQIDVPAGQHLIVMTAETGEAHVWQETIANQPGKADVTLVNVSDVPDLVLSVPAAKADVFKAMAPASTATRSLSAPLTLDFEFRSDGKSLASIRQVELKRKAGVTFVLVGENGDYTAFVSPNRYEK